MKTCLYNGKIYQGNKKFCEAILIEDGVIVDAGKMEDVLLNATNFKAIDLKGNTVLPGFNDSHMHLFELANTFAQANIAKAKSIDELINIVKQFIIDNPDLTKNGLYSRGFNNDYFIDDKRLMNKDDLDKISKDIPIVLSRVCGHVCVVNSLALKLLDEKYGLDNLPCSEVYKDSNGNYNGILSEFSVFKAVALIPEIDLKTKKKLLLKAFKYCASVGLTSIQSNDINDFENEQDIIETIDDLYNTNKNLIRYEYQCCFKDYDSFKKIVENNKYKLNKTNNKVTLGPLKLYKDGSLGARTAELYNDYNDDIGNKGIAVNSKQDIEKYVRLANKYHIQVITHSIGDKAIDEVASAYIDANGDKLNKNRHGIVHCQITNEDILRKCGENNLYILYQPIFLEYDLHIVESRVGKKLAGTSYAFKTIRKSGSKVSFGSDCPIEDCNPFYNLHCAINRLDLNNQPDTPYNQNECLDIYEAIDDFTIGSAYGQFKEKTLGKLDIGYYADLIVIKENIFNMDKLKIKDIKPLMTMVNGEIIYKR